MTTCSPLAEHHLHREPRKKRGCDLRLKQRLSVHQSVMSALGPRLPGVGGRERVQGVAWEGTELRRITAEETNCSAAGLHSLSCPARSDG